MNKFNLSIAMLYASLCVKGVCAQEHVRQVVTMEEMFSLADRNSKSLRPSVTAIDEAREAVRVAKNDKLPDIRASLSFSYLGDGTLMERDFTQMERAPIPHLGNNFALFWWGRFQRYTDSPITRGECSARLGEGPE